MTGPPPVLLDACVLVNFSLCDTLLRLAEPPRLYEPRWSQQIIAETTRALEAKLNWPRNLVAHFESELRTHFVDAWVEGYGHLIASVGNEPKDRHVLAAAVHSSTPVIVTFNLRHSERSICFRGGSLLCTRTDSWSLCMRRSQSLSARKYNSKRRTGTVR
ncbi:MAG: PIN domain-containing protein [Acidobacteria bacterium]|nr:PIN domain-containing protein [Acidobacteriota bacterium]